MALGDLLARFSKSSAVSMSNHLDELSGIEDESATTSMVYLPQTVVLCESRHEGFEDRVPSGLAKSGMVAKWRCMEVPLKTEFVVLVLCINIRADPSDVIKTSPCARMECWIDPFSMAPREAFEAIGGALRAQYQRWLPHAHYNMVRCHPTVEELQILCTNSRKHAQSHRVLFHYNGHDVPKPTANGQIWVYDKTKTQHIPLSFTDLDSWLGTPSVYVFDCSAAGMIVNSFVQHQDWSSSGTLSGSSMGCILFAACEAHETLPQSAEFPTDFFTSCLTTPIKMALWWLCSRSLLRDSLDKSFIDQIPGRQNDRKTLLGELYWIFTAVTDTIAWNILPPELFQRLFRRDKLVASLFRNFLLADRIMRAANCSPVSYPVLPTAHQHYLWDAWDMAAEICLSKLPLIADDPNAEFQPSPFFTEQLMAFEVWLDHGSEHKKPPKQLPIVLQVLLCLPLRFRALVLLGRFVDMGSWAVELALSVGILTYILKLLSSAAIEVRQTLVFIWTKIFALDKSCQVDMVMNGGHVFIIKFLDSVEAFPEQRAMAAFILAVVVDGYQRGQVACIQASLIHVCLRHLQLASSHDAQTEPLLLQWLCLCLGKSWENFPVAQAIGLQLDALATCAPLLSEPQPEVRAAAVFALGTLLDVDGHGGDDGRDDDEKTKSDLNIITCILQVVGDGSPMVRAEVAVALGRFAFSHNRHLKSIAFACLKPQSNSKLNLLASLANISSPSGYAYPSHHYMQPTSVPSSQFCTILRSSDRDGRISTSCPLTSSGVMHGSPLSDDSSEHSGSGIMLNRSTSTGVMYYSRPRPIDSATYSQCVLAMSTLAKDPSPRIASLGRRTLSIIGIERVVSKTAKLSEGSTHQVDFSTSSRPSVPGLTRSSSWLDMNAGHLPMTFGTPPVSPPRQNFVAGLRRVYSLELQPRHMNFPDPGLADPGLSFSGSTGVLERSLLPQSTIYNWSCGHFSRPLLTAADDREEMIARREDRERTALDHLAKCQRSSVRKLNNPIASWDTKFETGMKATLLLPFSPVVVAADENEIIRVWNYEEPTAFTPMNSFNNHDLSDSGISKLCLMNELDDSLLLVASCDGNVRIWKDYTVKGKQKLVTAFSAIQGQRPGFCTSAIVDWQHLSGYLYASSGASPILLWDLDKEQHASSISSSSDSSISVMSCSQVQGGQLAAGFMDGSVKIFDIHTPDMPVCSMRPHTQTVERVVGIGFQPGLDSSKIVSASQAGDIQFLDIRNPSKAYLTINAHRGSLTALAIHRHAPVIASGSSQQIVKVFSLYGDQLSAIKYHSTFMARRIGSVSCLAFHPYKVVLAAGDADAFVSVFADDS